MADDDRELKLTGKELKKIEDLADSSDRVSKRRGDKKEKVKKEREDTAYGAALDPIMEQGFKGREAGDLARTVAESMRKSRRGAVLYDNPRSKRKD